MGERENATPDRGAVGVVLVVGPPRCGTTAAFDAIRSHPRARFDRSASLFGRLVRGQHSRYPRDLCVQSGGLRIEQQPREIVRVPGFGRREEDNTGEWMVEKLHPHFFHFEPGWLIERLRSFEKARLGVRLVLRVRDPRAMLRSQWLYKRRVPSWQGWQSEDAVASFAARSYGAIQELAERRPDSIVSVYENDAADPVEAIARVWRGLWPDEDEAARLEQAAGVAEAVGLERRGDFARSRFTAEGSDHDESEIETLFKSAAKDLRVCDAAYGAVVEAAGRS